VRERGGREGVEGGQRRMRKTSLAMGGGNKRRSSSSPPPLFIPSFSLIKWVYDMGLKLCYRWIDSPTQAQTNKEKEVVLLITLGGSHHPINEAS